MKESKQGWLLTTSDKHKHADNGDKGVNDNIVEKKEWKIAPELIKTKSSKPKKVGALRDGKGINDENKKNKSRSGRSSKKGGSRPRRNKFSGEEYFTFSLDGLIPAYGDPSQVGSLITNDGWRETSNISRTQLSLHQ